MAEALDIGGKDKDGLKDYQKLMAADGSLYEIFPAIETVRDVGGIDLRVFMRIDEDADPESYVLTGEEELIFLYVNGTDENIAARINIDGRVSSFCTVKSYSTVYGQEESPAAWLETPAEPEGAADGTAEQLDQAQEMELEAVSWKLQIPKQPQKRTARRFPQRMRQKE